jgi:hypothetical protein
MKIEFEGPNVSSLVSQAQMFALAFKGETPVSIPEAPIQTEEKRKPGRPPNPGSKKAKEKEIVDEPISPTTDDLFDEPIAPKHVSKDDLTESLKKLSETHSINKVREVFTKFGVARLGELDEKRYHEMHTFVQAML